MVRKQVEPSVIDRQFDEDYSAALNMIGEGSPDYAADQDDSVPEEMKREEQKAQDLH
jgi:hypothetical protein